MCYVKIILILSPLKSYAVSQCFCVTQLLYKIILFFMHMVIKNSFTNIFIINLVNQFIL